MFCKNGHKSRVFAAISIKKGANQSLQPALFIAFFSLQLDTWIKSYDVLTLILFLPSPGDSRSPRRWLVSAGTVFDTPCMYFRLQPVCSVSLCSVGFENVDVFF